MSTEIIKSKALCKSVKGYIADKIKQSGIEPHLKIYTTTLDPASTIYVGAKQRACESVGIRCSVVEIAAGYDLKTSLEKDYHDPSVHGVLVQKPTIKGFRDEWVHPSMDVDGFNPFNAGLLYLGYDRSLCPCTPLGVMLWMKKLIKPAGKHAVVVGRSAIVGRPMASICAAEDMAVTLLHQGSENNPQIAKTADVLIVAAGSPGLITKDWIKPGVIIFDVGINRLEDGRIVGDVDQTSVDGIASVTTAVPGGVGPMTVTMVLWNTCHCAGVSVGSLDEYWESV